MKSLNIMYSKGNQKNIHYFLLIQAICYGDNKMLKIILLLD